MTSPFPGMDPYLEQPAFWSSFQRRMGVAIADAIEPALQPSYYVEVETRTYLSEGDDSVLIGIPDAVVAARTKATPPAPTSQAGVTVQSRPQRVMLPMPEEVNERYLEIRELETGDVITAIELLSPKNKRSGKGRIAYEEKRTQILSSLTHLVEIDLLRGGQSMALLGNVPPTDYQILVSIHEQRPAADLYAFTLREPLPTIPLPLKPGDEPISLALQTVFEGVYRRGRYQTRIDYSQNPPPPALPEADRQWLDQLLGQQSLR